MAALLQFTVTPATQDQFNELDDKLEKSMMQGGGGPPPGLMSHVVYPDRDGFVVADVWRSESDGQAFVNEVLQPLLAALGMTASEVTVLPVWSFARP